MAVIFFTAGEIRVTARADALQSAVEYNTAEQNAAQRSETSPDEAPQLQLYAQTAVLMDADSGRVLYGKNESEMLPMASTTKIMTCILALEYGNLDDIVEVSDYAASMPKVKLYVNPGEKYRLGDLLYSLMLESHNDSAVVIAEAVGGSIEEFAAMMNQKARDIGCYDTYFITPNGLDAVVNNTGKIHSTTAADLARIMAYCVTQSTAKDEFLEITRTREYTFYDADGKRSFHCSNHNSFLNMMDEALSGKTGFTNKAGYCYVGAVESEGRIFTVALLACGWPNHKTYKWSDMKKLAEYGMENYEYRDIYEKKEFERLMVQNGIAGEEATPYDIAYIKADLEEDAPQSLPYLLCARDVVEVKTSLVKTLKAPVHAGEKVGEVSYYLNGELLQAYPVISMEEVEAIDYRFILQYIVTLFLPL
ncbi:MAG: D-alanyl-D-alanine carboxypeptidase [Bacillus sp. (in: Bacteria)]|nr:D-alanyl-D-alanine carboxypeptidase [Bacillus sp. (in: firmicutes)]MCM1428096.1 D-alanyl-D-alanine carboxypeptidase [Eubacterium sp.]